jgi:hypothetical protein
MSPLCIPCIYIPKRISLTKETLSARCSGYSASRRVLPKRTAWNSAVDLKSGLLDMEAAQI